MTVRRHSRRIMVGGVPVGDGAPVPVQSMLNVRTADVSAAQRQIQRLAEMGAGILRLSVDNAADAAALRELAATSPVPLVADIQFDWRCAVMALESGAAAVRVNPGLLPSSGPELAAVAAAVIEYGAAIRVGANAGSIGETTIRREQSRGLSREAALARVLAERTLEQCEALERFGVRNIKAALKCSSVPVTVAANLAFAARSDLPLHIGVTEAGTPYRGVVKSAAGIGALLLSGVGDTIRVSLTGPPEEEIRAGLAILESCGLRPAEPEIVSCPTCGRTEIDLAGLTAAVEAMVEHIKSSGRKIKLAKLAVMGCPVNGPGEARDADLGLAGTRSGQVVLFRRGETLGAFTAAEGLERLRELVLAAAEPENPGNNPAPRAVSPGRVRKSCPDS